MRRELGGAVFRRGRGWFRSVRWWRWFRFGGRRRRDRFGHRFLGGDGFGRRIRRERGGRCWLARMLAALPIRWRRLVRVPRPRPPRWHGVRMSRPRRLGAGAHRLRRFIRLLDGQGTSLPYLRQANVPFQRRRLGRPQQPGQRRDSSEHAEAYGQHLRQSTPTDPQRSHRDPRPRSARALPLRTAQAAVLRRSSSMSASWSSTQSPGLREKMISFRPSDHSRLVTGSRVSARWIASACCWMSKGLTEIT